jgi:hypothetical protein
MENKELQVGKTYKFTHRKKGVFIGQLLAFIQTDLGDNDPYFLRVKVDTREGTAQNKLTWTKVDSREIDIRPSHITASEEVEPDKWLLKQARTSKADPRELYQNDLKLTVKAILDEKEQLEKQQQKPSVLQRFKQYVSRTLGGSHG